MQWEINTALNSTTKASELLFEYTPRNIEGNKLLLELSRPKAVQPEEMGRRIGHIEEVQIKD